MILNEQEINFIKYMAEWFRNDPRGLMQREAVKKEVGLDDTQYDVMVKSMEHYAQLKKLRLLMVDKGMQLLLRFRPTFNNGNVK